MKDTLKAAYFTKQAQAWIDNNQPSIAMFREARGTMSNVEVAELMGDIPVHTDKKGNQSSPMVSLIAKLLGMPRKVREYERHKKRRTHHHHETPDEKVQRLSLELAKARQQQANAPAIKEVRRIIHKHGGIENFLRKLNQWKMAQLI